MKRIRAVLVFDVPEDVTLFEVSCSLAPVVADLGTPCEVSLAEWRPPSWHSTPGLSPGRMGR